jgi:hypothetical protein
LGAADDQTHVCVCFAPNALGTLCPVDSWRALAALNNAEWCDAVCRSHGRPTRIDEIAWTSQRRTPPYYPDAVTLVPNPSVDQLLSRIDGAAGCSIKDSFASLDLTAYGFHVLIEAQWIVRTGTGPPAEQAGQRWSLVRDPASLMRWARAWQGDDGPTDIFKPELLTDASVAVVGAFEGDHVVAGAVLNRSSMVVGISNLFADSSAVSTSWSACLSFADSLFPAATFVGYESGDRLETARRHGFETAGALRVWTSKDQLGSGSEDRPSPLAPPSGDRGEP